MSQNRHHLSLASALHAAKTQDHLTRGKFIVQMQQGREKLLKRSELMRTTEMLDWAYICVKKSWSHVNDFLVVRF